jgi:hypothetical protein
MRMWTALIQLGMGYGGRLCELGNDTSGSKKSGNFLNG